MNKRFASFLFAGKIAALPLFAQESLSAVLDISSNNHSLIKVHETSALETLSVKKSGAHEGYNAILLTDTIFENRIPKILNLVITGLYHRDEVLIVISPEKDTAKILESNSDLLSDSHNFVILNRFSITDIPYSSKTILDKKHRENVSPSKITVRPISLPIDLTLFPDLSREGNSSYLHVLVAPRSKWDERYLIRHSEVLELKKLDKSILLSQYTEDCTVYTCY
jgi:hypothetical protein